MVISYNWLQSYFTEKLPSPEELSDLITFHIWEVEGVTAVTLSDGTTDTVLDIKVLPDRACYALSHQGVAYEVGAIIGQKPLKVSDLVRSPREILKESGQSVSISVISETCNRYLGRIVENIAVAETPHPIKMRLEAIGQRSINSIVDMMNYVMFDTGQPLHAFDADLVAGNIVVREAEEGEKMTTLDGKEISLGKGMTVIADSKGPLALAGVKGGNRAGVTEKTKRIIIESANFDAVAVRKTATATFIKTDASKRFENNLSAETASLAMDVVTRLIITANSAAAVGPITDIYTHPESPTALSIDPKEISSILGIQVSPEEIKNILERLEIKMEEKNGSLFLAIPSFRKDLNSSTDIAEEVGRLYGYDKLPVIALPRSDTQEEIVPAYFYEQKIRAILLTLGFSEIYTPTIVKDGDVVIANPLASDKRALRTGLREGLLKSIESNTYYAPLLGLSTVKVFEIGTVFPGEKENSVLGLALHDIVSKGKKNGVLLEETLQALQVSLGVDISPYVQKNNGVCEINLSELFEILPMPKEYDVFSICEDISFRPFSPYPFIIRDIALFVPESASEQDIREILTEKAGPLLVRLGLFDVFKKTVDGAVKVSYAFRLVFQSTERTLTDQEIENIVNAIHAALVEKGWQVR